MAASAAPGESYPLFTESSYWIPRSERRKRWWYADAIWIDQGSTANAVAVAWTHWLADRGMRSTDGNFDRAFARELDLEAREVFGSADDSAAGVFIRTAAQVLAERRLLEECYSCPDVESVVDALLERGPVVAGLGWRASMERVPAESDGWVLLRPGGADDELVGGHCVLLNGIDLDLEIDGVKGFVRLKNSWGTGWADGGHAMISLDDLATTLWPENFLPIPAPEKLAPGVKADIATDVPFYGPRENVYAQSAIGGDRWTERDTLGTKAYADAIARGIQHVETQPPLTIGIKGAWGAGKTSMMRMIQQQLEWPGSDHPSNEPRPIHLGHQGEEITNGAVLRKAKRASPVASGQVEETLKARPHPAAGETMLDHDPRWRPTVWFNPWKYQTSEQIWAGLASEIIDQITARMDRGERERFWLHLNLRRVDEQAVRRRIYGLILSRVVPYAILAVTLLLAGIFLLVAGRLDAVGKAVTAAGPTALLLGGGFTAWRVLSSSISTDLSGLVRPATDLAKAVGEELKAVHDSAVDHPDYRSRAGALSLLHEDVSRVLDLVVTPDRPLVIFIDDLDRCSPGSVVQVIEAINLFVAGDYPNTIFVIAMEPEMVAAHVEAAYGDLVDRLKQSDDGINQAFDLGWRFLDKIVQLPLAVPAMEDDRTAALFESLFARKAESPVPPTNGATVPKDPERAQEIVSASLSEAVAIAGDLRPEAAATEAVRRRVERKLTVEDPEVREVTEYASRFLRHNPREIKRFANLFRFYTMIYTERRLQNLPAPASLHEIAKLAVLGIRWPGLLSVLAMPTGENGGGTVFELLEDPPAPASDESGDDALSKALAGTGLSQATTELLLASKVKDFLASPPRVGTGISGYL